LATCPNPFKSITPKIRVVGVDDGAFPPNKRRIRRTLLVAVLFEGLRISSVRIGSIQVDGTDAQPVLLSLLRPIRFDVTMLSGISFAGFNLVDMDKLQHRTGKPVIAVTGDKPDNNAVRRALLDHFDDWKDRWRAVVAAGRLYSCKPLKEEPKLYFEAKGESVAFARKIIKSTAAISRLPEPIRVARILARGLSALIQSRSQ
jgi:endonuclease V-like protein UPF0215 family